MNKKILFFDDEPSYVNLLIDNLKLNYGWKANEEGEITFVSDPVEMIDKINSSNLYDLFVLDIMIPSYGIEKKGIFTKKEIQRIERDNNMGILIAEKIRAIIKYEKTPILFLTGKGNREIPESLGDSVDTVVKPTLVKDLSNKMKNMLNQ